MYKAENNDNEDMPQSKFGKLEYDPNSLLGQGQKKLTLTELRSLPEESDSESELVIDFYSCPFEESYSSWKNALIESQKLVTPPSSGEDCDKPFPYLIAPFYDQGNYVMICSKPFPSIYKSKLRSVNEKSFMERYVKRKFTAISTDEVTFRNELYYFLKYNYTHI